MIVNNGFVDLFVKTTSEAAYASSLLKGKGDKIAADQAAVDKMRLFLNNIPMKGKIVIGEGDGGASVWISDNPPSYAAGLPRPYGPGGSFRVNFKKVYALKAF